jgi:hypothetical protein
VVVAEELREDARAVAALLRLAAVRVEDAHAEVRAVGWRHEQNSVRTDATMAVADETDGLRRDLERDLRRIDHDVVVAEAM